MTAPPRSTDLAEIAAVLGRFFDAFTSSPSAEEVDARLDALRDVVLPTAVIARTCGREPEVTGVEDFIAPRRAMLTDGTLTGFREWPEQGRVDRFGDVAHWFGRYAKTGGAGAKSVQLVRTSAGWRISAVAWDDDRDGLGRDDLQSSSWPDPYVRDPALADGGDDERGVSGEASPPAMPRG